MPRKRQDVTPPDTNAAEDFTLSQPQPAQAATEPKAPRLGAYIPLTADGQVDRKRIRPSQEENVNRAIAALKAEASSSAPGAVAGEVQFITEAHITMALGLYAQGCAYAVPAYLRKQSQGAINIDRGLAQRVYQFTPEQLAALTPAGVEFANQQFANLPQWMKDWLLAIGPGAKFFGQLAFITAMQTRTLIDEWKRMQPTPTAPEQKTNGGLVTDVEGADKDVLN